MPDIITADLHVRRRADEQFAFEQIVDAAIATKAGRVFALGDLFERQTQRSAPVAFFMRQLDRLEEADIHFCYLQGQHDFDEPTWLSGHRWVIHVHGREIDLAGGHRAYGLDFRPHGTLQEELKEVPEACDVLLCHQTWADWMGEDRNPQGSFAEVPGHVRYLFTGDLHAWKFAKHENDAGKKMVVLSPGATAQQKINEPAAHYYAVVGNDNVITKVPLKSRPFVDWPVMTTKEDVDAFADQIEACLAEAAQRAQALGLPEAVATPRIRVTYSHRLTDAVRRVERAVAGRALLYWKELPPEEKSVRGPATAGAPGGAVTPLALLGEEIDQAKEPESHALAARLLESNGDPAEELRRWWDQQMGETGGQEKSDA